MATTRRNGRSRGRSIPNSRPSGTKAGRESGKAVNRRGPLNPDEPMTVGRRPSSPRFLLLVAVMWLAVGVIVIVALQSTWKLIPAIFAIGVGLFFLRGAGATVVRRERRHNTGE